VETSEIAPCSGDGHCIIAKTRQEIGSEAFDVTAKADAAEKRANQQSREQRKKQRIK
jgi:hypothetical protein